MVLIHEHWWALEASKSALFFAFKTVTQKYLLAYFKNVSRIRGITKRRSTHGKRNVKQRGSNSSIRFRGLSG
ncbi:hypothetical protein OKN36_16270 [Furfurilactobacillus sp. OKN36]